MSEYIFRYHNNAILWLSTNCYNQNTSLALFAEVCAKQKCQVINVTSLHRRIYPLEILTIQSPLTTLFLKPIPSKRGQQVQLKTKGNLTNKFLIIICVAAVPKGFSCNQIPASCNRLLQSCQYMRTSYRKQISKNVINWLHLLHTCPYTWAWTRLLSHFCFTLLSLDHDHLTVKFKIFSLPLKIQIHGRKLSDNCQYSETI